MVWPAAWKSRSAGIPCVIHPKGLAVIILGLILLLLGVVFGIWLLYTLGAILLVVGVILYVLGASNRAVGGRRHYF